MSSESQIQLLDVAIIGAGWYGLAAAKNYLKLQPETELRIFDGDASVGGVWSRARIYPNLVAQVPHGFFNYPGYSMPRDGKTDHNLVTGNMICDYLEKFAKDHDLVRRIQFKSWVNKIERCTRGWRLTVNGNSFFETRKLIVSTGVTSVPNELPFKVEDSAIPIIHSRDICENVKAMSADHVQNVVIVGAAKSAYDAAYLLSTLGKKVTWVIRPDGSGPMPIMPAEVLGMNTISTGSTRMMSYLSPSLFYTNTWLGSFFHRTAIGRWLTRSHWQYITSQANKAAGFGGDAGNVEGLKPEVTNSSCFWCDSSLGLITLGDFWQVLKAGNLRIIRENVETAHQSGVVLASGENIKADYVISCTGWGDHFSFMSAELKEELGIPMYGAAPPAKHSDEEDFWAFHDKTADDLVAKQIPLLATGPEFASVHPERKVVQRRWRLYNRCVPFENARAGDRSLVVLGQIHTVQTPTIAEIQSFWAILYMLGEVNLPEEKTMINEIAEWNAWTRKRYASVGERYPYALFDWIPYLDRLLGDAGVNGRRMSNPIKDFFVPYGPQAYNGYLEEYLTKRPKKAPVLKRADSGVDLSS